jgi:hypothetical protein
VKDGALCALVLTDVGDLPSTEVLYSALQVSQWLVVEESDIPAGVPCALLCTVVPNMPATEVLVAGSWRCGLASKQQEPVTESVDAVGEDEGADSGNISPNKVLV